MVGEAIATKLISLGHHVCMGSRTAGNDKAVDWVARVAAGERATQAAFVDAVNGADIVFFCTNGGATLEVARTVGDARLAGKTVIDVSNPLDFSRGLPPSLSICNTDSLGEELQKALPGAGVVKTLNIVNCEVMVEPAKVPGQPTMLICGNDARAKATAVELLRSFGWSDILDLGGIIAARGTEMMLPVWLSTWQALGSPYFGFRIVR